MRVLSFGPDGRGDLVHLILGDQRRVDLPLVLWIG